MTNSEMDKLGALLEQRYSLFHADLIMRAISDESVSREDFMHGCEEILANEGDNEEYNNLAVRALYECVRTASIKQ